MPNLNSIYEKMVLRDIVKKKKKLIGKNIVFMKRVVGT